MLTLGIIFGLTAAVLQAISYLPTRWYVLRRPKSLPQLLAIAHVQQAVVCIPLLWFFWPSDMPHYSVYYKPIIAESLCYFIGQIGLFMALRFTDASRVSPLLSMKVVILAILSTLFMGQHLTSLQWIAAVMAVLAALILNQSGGSIPWRAGLGLLIAWLGYSFSDFYIRTYIEVMTPMNAITAGLVGLYMSFLFCGLIGAVMLPWYGSRNYKDWRDAVPYAFFWFVAMLFFYSALAAAGLVLAAILQSTRALWSIALGAIIAHRGHHTLETHISKGVLFRRTIASLMMVTAITLYVVQSHKQQAEEATESPGVELPVLEEPALGEQSPSLSSPVPTAPALLTPVPQSPAL